MQAFGEGQFQTRNDRVATREYDFEDSNLDAFLVYDYKATSETTSAQRKNNFGIVKKYSFYFSDGGC